MKSLTNILYTYYIPTFNKLHSDDIESCYSHYIKYQTTQDFKCINNWSFLNQNELNKKIVLFNDKEIIHITNDVFLLKYEIRNIGHTLLNILYQIIYYIDNNFNCKILIQTELININKYVFSIINLFINMDNIIIIDSSKIYNFDKFIYTNEGYMSETNN